MENWIEELEKLGNLRDLGILTEEEFQAGKKKLLAMRKKVPSGSVGNVDPDIAYLKLQSLVDGASKIK